MAGLPEEPDEDDDVGAVEVMIYCADRAIREFGPLMRRGSSGAD